MRELFRLGSFTLCHVVCGVHFRLQRHTALLHAISLGLQRVIVLREMAHQCP